MLSVRVSSASIQLPSSNEDAARDSLANIVASQCDEIVRAVFSDGEETTAKNV